jgi:hypothetical protein
MLYYMLSIAAPLKAFTEGNISTDFPDNDDV